MKFQHPPDEEQNFLDNDSSINKRGFVTFNSEARSEKGQRVIIRQYGLLDPLDWSEDCQEQLFLQNKFWNRLVEIERAQRSAYREIISRDPEVGPLTLKIDELKTQKEEAIRNRKRMRQAARSRKKAGTQELDQLIGNLSAEIQMLSSQAKQKRAESKTRLQPLLKQLEEERRVEVKEARRSSGLWWGNYNAVWKSYDMARVRAIREGAGLRFHTFDGTGRFTNQIPGGITLKRLFDGSHSQVSVQPLPEEAYTSPHRGERRRQQRTCLTITVYRRQNENGKEFRRTLTFPMIMHRPIPEEALIKEIVVKRSKEGTKFRWSVTFMAILPKTEPVKSPSRLITGIDLGWRKVPEGLRVATLVDSSNEVQFIVLPDLFLRRLDHVDQLKSKIDCALNEILSWLKSQMQMIQSKAPDELQHQFDSLLSAGRPAGKQLVQLTLAWRERYSEFHPELWRALERWRKKDKCLRNEWGNLRDKALRWRTDFYRNVSKDIGARYGFIVLKRLDLRGLAASEKQDGSAGPQHIQARKMRYRAAVSDLRRWIELQAIKSGSAVLYHQGSSTVTCHACGCVNKPKRADRMILDLSCEICGMIWDQDKNAAINLRDSIKEIGISATSIFNPDVEI